MKQRGTERRRLCNYNFKVDELTKTTKKMNILIHVSSETKLKNKIFVVVELVTTHKQVVLMFSFRRHHLIS